MWVCGCLGWAGGDKVVVVAVEIKGMGVEEIGVVATGGHGWRGQGGRGGDVSIGRVGWEKGGGGHGEDRDGGREGWGWMGHGWLPWGSMSGGDTGSKSSGHSWDMGGGYGEDMGGEQ